MGSFARAHVPSFSDAEMDAFEMLLDVPDWEVYDFVRRAKNPPPELAGPVMDKLLGFRIDP